MTKKSGHAALFLCRAARFCRLTFDLTAGMLSSTQEGRFMKSTPTRLAAFWLAVAGMAFFAMAASSPQCARTSENVTGPSLGAQGTADACTQGCIDAYQSAKKAEQARFKAAMAACNGDLVCREATSEAHDAIVLELVADKDACIANCAHQQGTGLGGQ
jgi:hypothetical protein